MGPAITRRPHVSSSRASRTILPEILGCMWCIQRLSALRSCAVRATPMPICVVHGAIGTRATCVDPSKPAGHTCASCLAIRRLQLDAAIRTVVCSVSRAPNAQSSAPGCAAQQWISSVEVLLLACYGWDTPTAAPLLRAETRSSGKQRCEGPHTPRTLTLGEYFTV